MIRYYESIGLIKAPLRTESGYRVYSDNDVHALRFISQARDLGFSVEQMGSLLALWRDRSRAGADVKSIALEHIRALDEKARALQAMSKTLRHLADHCHGDDRPDCPIIEGFAAADAADAKEAAAAVWRHRDCARSGARQLKTRLDTRPQLPMDSLRRGPWRLSACAIMTRSELQLAIPVKPEMATAADLN